MEVIDDNLETKYLIHCIRQYEISYPEMDDWERESIHVAIAFYSHWLINDVRLNYNCKQHIKIIEKLFDSSFPKMKNALEVDLFINVYEELGVNNSFASNFREDIFSSYNEAIQYWLAINNIKEPYPPPILREGYAYVELM